MKPLILRRIAATALAGAALATTLVAPAQAGRGWGHHGHGYHHHHGHYHGGTDWWGIGALALVGAGLYLAATAEPDYPEVPYSPPPPYYSRNDYGQYAPSYGADPNAPTGYPVDPGYAAPPAPVDGPAASSAPLNASAATPAETDCHRAAVNYSGYDPAMHTRWTTQVSVNSYQRALQDCLAGRRG